MFTKLDYSQWIIKNKQILHDKHLDESKTRTHWLSKLPDDGDPWAPNNLLTPEQKKIKVEKKRINALSNVCLFPAKETF